MEKKKLYETERSRNIESESRVGGQGRQSFHQRFKNEEHTKWEITQLMNSGTFKMKDANFDPE